MARSSKALLLVLASSLAFAYNASAASNGLYSDRTPMAQVLTNLAFGGFQFLRDGGESLASELPDATPSLDQSYDFIVVGAGSAGATVASRLSELKDATVLLIEAGRNENLLMDIPVLVNYLQFSDDLNWKYKTEPSTSYCQGMKDRRCNWPRGKVMGGSSVLNYMIATRGNPLDYDSWADMGNEGWSYPELLKYFKKLEAMGISELRRDKRMHNTNGPVNIDYPPYHTPVAEGFLRAGQELGYNIVDYNAKQEIGFSFIQATIKNGTRMSTNRAYLYPARKRKNLYVSKMSQVSKVLIEPQAKRAYGVEFVKQGQKMRARARREVILCAGAIGTPQILMLSGIGPEQHLNEMGIPALQNLPVGKNLMDHIAYGGLVFLIDKPVSIKATDLTNPMMPYIGDFFTKRSGPLTVPGGCEALAFIDVDNKPKHQNSPPNMELLFIGGSVVSDPAFRYTFGISDEHWNKMFAKISGSYSWTIFPMLMQPKSRGEILLRSRDPKVKPKIYANYFDHPEDVRIMVKGIRAAIEVSKTRAMQEFNSTLYEVPVPGCEHHPQDSDAYWECAARTFTFTIYHYSGTCKMAPENDPTGVVNPRLQVKGIKGLRVADASIMPNIMTGHPNIPVIMIGEKLADMVKEDWGYQI